MTTRKSFASIQPSVQKDRLLLGDCLTELRKLAPDSVDLVCTDPPYGIGFMGKEWDTFKPDKTAKSAVVSGRNPASGHLTNSARRAGRRDHAQAGAVKFREWLTTVATELLRVLKPGAFAFVCIGARQDSVASAITAFAEAGFKTDFTSLFWTYASGFPKAAHIGRLVDKRVRAGQQVIDKGRVGAGTNKTKRAGRRKTDRGTAATASDTYAVSCDAGRVLDGAYGGFQPKPAVEVIIVATKPLSKKSFVDQALASGKGVTWLDAGRIPYRGECANIGGRDQHGWGDGYGFRTINRLERWSRHGQAVRPRYVQELTDKGRFPANLVVSDTVLGHYSRFFDLDAWFETTFPFCLCAKASKRERNAGLERLPMQASARLPLRAAGGAKKGRGADGSRTDRTTQTRNTHPTVKPLKLMAYLIALGSRPGDVVLDAFLGSGTTAIAAAMLDRRYIGIERETEYLTIARARLVAAGSPASTLKTLPRPGGLKTRP